MGRIMDTILHRRSIRRFAPEQVDERTLQQILQAGLYALERDPKDSACRTLEYMLARCRAAERRAQEEADRARVLFPRLGAALGLVSAILLL